MLRSYIVYILSKIARMDVENTEERLTLDGVVYVRLLSDRYLGGVAQ